MSVNHEIKEQRAKLKDAPFKEKSAYFWEYYKWQTIGGIGGLILLVFLVNDIIKANRPIYMEGLYINAGLIDYETLQTEYANVVGANEDETPLSITSMTVTTEYSSGDITDSYYDKQKLMAMIAAAEIDFFISDEAVFLPYAKEETFLDLSECFSEEELKQWEDSLYTVTYVDGSSHIVGIDITSIPYLTDHLKYYQYLSKNDEGNDQVYFSIVCNSSRVDRAKDYFDYISSYQAP